MAEEISPSPQLREAVKTNRPNQEDQRTSMVTNSRSRSASPAIDDDDLSDSYYNDEEDGEEPIDPQMLQLVQELHQTILRFYKEDPAALTQGQLFDFDNILNTRGPMIPGPEDPDEAVFLGEEVAAMFERCAMVMEDPLMNQKLVVEEFSNLELSEELVETCQRAVKAMQRYIEEANRKARCVQEIIERIEKVSLGRVVDETRAPAAPKRVERVFDEGESGGDSAESCTVM